MGNRWMQIAVLSAVPDRSAALARIRPNRGNERGRPLLRPLAAVAGTQRRGRNRPTLPMVADLSSEKLRGIRESVMTGLIEGLARDPPGKQLSAAGIKALERCLPTRQADQRQVLRLAGLVRLRTLAHHSVPYVKLPSRPHSISNSLSPSATCRAGIAQRTRDELALRELLDVRQPIELQLRRLCSSRPAMSPSPRVAFQGMVVVFLVSKRLSRLLLAPQGSTSRSF
jgi:hypothetical protein